MKLLFSTFSLLFYSMVYSQSLNVDPQKSKMTVYGTSTLHDWHMEANTFKGSATIQKDSKRVNSISSLLFIIPTESLKSGKSSMDNNTYEALKTKQHKEIKYQLTKVQSINPSKDGKGFIITALGKLTISGKTIEEKMKVYSLVQADGSVQFIGEITFLMSKYGIDPPTAVMGTIKTGDELTMKFNVIYK